MILIYIAMFISITTVLGVLVWFALQDQNIVCNSNGCTGDCSQGRNCSCVTIVPEINPNWPFPAPIVPEINPNWPFPTQPKP